MGEAERPDTIPALLARRRAADGDRRALVTDAAAVTYRELDDASAARAARFVAAGVGKGDRFGLLAPNGIEWAVTAYAALRIGAVLVPLSTLLRPPELLAQLKAAAVAHLVVAPELRDRRYLDDLETAAPGLVVGVQHGRRHEAAPALRNLWSLGDEPGPADHVDGDPIGGSELVRALESRVRAADDLAVLFTSGSRGAPKGTIHTHGGGLRAVAAGLEVRGVGPGARLYLPMPFFWTGGFTQGLLTALVAGATLLTEAEPEPEATIALLEREQATLFRGWPDQAARLAAHPAFAAADLSSLSDFSLGAVLAPSRRPAPGARPNLFGMTETFGPWCGAPLDTDLPADKWGSCGRPLAGVDVQVVDPETATVVAADEPGELWVRGPNVMRGICGRARSEVFTVDGWYRTGDLGRVDADGYVWYSGRLDDMVKVKGASVYPSEVEAALRTVPGVHQAFVTDVALDGAPEVAALVVTEAELGEVRAATRERLSAFKVPTRWLLTADAAAVPMSATGKVDKPGLQQLLLDEGTKGTDR